MELQADVAHVAELVARNAQLGIDLVDDRAGPARAFVVHRGDLLLLAGLRVFLEDDYLRVLPPELDHRPGFGVELLDGERDGVDFLNEFRADARRDAAAARARDEDSDVLVRDGELGFDALEKFEAFFRLFRVVPLIIAPDYFVAHRIDDDGLNGGGPHVQPYEEFLVSSAHILLLQRIRIL
jgi:hypothetical protein